MSSHTASVAMPCSGIAWNSRWGATASWARRCVIPTPCPPHLAADEHHAQLRGEDAYVAMTAGGGCVLGMALSNTASEVDLTAAYGRFRDEAGAVSADYAPETVNTDGWKATQAAWRTLFPKVVLILCFLHGFLKVRDRCRKAFELHGKIWEVYQA